ncbi:MAG: DUF4956 domain-containing protein [Anaerolineae bacterium]|nr:DUF4956 domain-containing protein [Anaerolineae bacterium]
MDNLLGITTPAPLSLATLALNLLLGILLSSATMWFYTRFGKSLSNRARFAQTLPILTLITILVISVVKSSLALSLGLVGALSIVRFRTAIKEPEELVFLFLAIGIGLGIGADQRWPTVLAATLILGYIYIRSLMIPQSMKNNLYLSVQSPATDGFFATINELLLQHVESADLRRLDRNTAGFQATYLISCSSEKTLISLMDDLGTRLPACEFSFVEQDNTLGA